MPREPLTASQSKQLMQDVAAIQELATAIEDTLGAAFGEVDSRAVRAQQVAAAIQRLEWALSRSDPDQAPSEDSAPE
jgi:hypothetical protein